MPNPTIIRDKVLTQVATQNTSRVADAMAEIARQRQAREAVMNRWMALGGPRSPLGLPRQASFDVEPVAGGYEVPFRGGTMKVMGGDPSKAIESVTRQVIVTFEGYGLEMRQEKGDDIYGYIAAKIGSTGYKKDFDIPIARVGPDDNNRVRPYSVILWEGPPVDLNLAVRMVEHDAGDSQAIRDEIRKRVNQIFDTAAQAAGGSAVDVALSGYAGEAQANGDLVRWLLNAAADGIAELLGLGDDPYNEQGMTITADQMQRDLAAKTYRCWSDPHTIEYTHALTCDGYDDAGDHGRITLLFRVRPR